VPVICLGLAAMTFAVFGQTLTHEFVNVDDNDYVYHNPLVARGLTLRGLLWAFTRSRSGNWHPLTWLSHMLDCQLYGLHPGGHHLTNVLLHTATVILLFLVLRQMTGALWRSAFVAAVFAIHPLRVESVAWVAERKDVLSGLFFMLTIGAYLSYTRRPWSPVRYGLVMLLFALGLICKQMLVTLPLVLLLLDYWPLQRVESARRLVTEKSPLLALSAAAGVATLLAQDEGIKSGGSFSLPHRLGNALASSMIYLGQMVWPMRLAFLYPYPHNGPPLWEVALAVVLLAGLSAVAWHARRTRPWLLIGWLWYLVMLLPVVGIIQVGRQAHADRYTYLPQIGIYVALTWLVAQWRLSRVALGGLMTGVLAVLMACTWQQTAYWQNSETLWTRDLACTAGNDFAHFSLGTALAEEGRADEAITHYQMALQLNPNYAEAHYNLGIALAGKGRADEAITHYRMALQIDPNYARAHNNLATALMLKGRADEAITHYQMALQISPNYAEPHVGLGNALLQQRNVNEAITQYQMALQINPNYAEAHYALGNALAQKGRADQAINHWEMALQINPNNAEAHYYLGNALFQKGRADQAITHYQMALQINSNFAEAHYNLGLALARKGRADEAITQYQLTLQINPNSAKAHNNLGNALMKKGRAIEALSHYQQALQIEPANAKAQDNLAWLLATCADASLRNGAKAVELARQANELSGGADPGFLATLAAAFAESGRFSDATQTAQKAMELAQVAGQQDLVEQLKGELKRYQAGFPWRQ
jgi:tetratricopeptide (TPR) repeat protein